MDTVEQIERAALALREARISRRPIPPSRRPTGLTRSRPPTQLQRSTRKPELADGRRLTGRKIGLTSKAVQRQLGVDQPDFGALFDDMELINGATAVMATLIQPKVEAEIALVISRDLARDRKPSWGQFLDAIDFAIPAIEIVDSAIADWQITIADTIADNASSGLYVLGDQPVDIGAVQLADVEMRMRVNGEIVSKGQGSACLGHPLRAAYWLACALAERGEALRAGEIILSGALGPTAPVKSGDRSRGRLWRMRWGELRLSLSAGGSRQFTREGGT